MADRILEESDHCDDYARSNTKFGVHVCTIEHIDRCLVENEPIADMGLSVRV